jgi:hypothetical protein
VEQLAMAFLPKDIWLPENQAVIQIFFVDFDFIKQY